MHRVGAKSFEQRVGCARAIYLDSRPRKITERDERMRPPCRMAKRVRHQRKPDDARPSQAIEHLRRERALRDGIHQCVVGDQEWRLQCLEALDA